MRISVNTSSITPIINIVLVCSTIASYALQELSPQFTISLHRSVERQVCVWTKTARTTVGSTSDTERYPYISSSPRYTRSCTCGEAPAASASWALYDRNITFFSHSKDLLPAMPACWAVGSETSQPVLTSVAGCSLSHLRRPKNL